METIRELYKAGPGPSSSHTLAPYRACKMFLEDYPDVSSVNIELYGSLSLTGKGHFTDYIIKKTFANIPCSIDFKLDWDEEFPSGFYLYGNVNGKIIKWTVFSIGGGTIKIREKDFAVACPYQEKSLVEIKKRCQKEGWSLCDYVYQHEDDNIRDYLKMILKTMDSCVEKGLQVEGFLPGSIKIERCASKLYQKAISENDQQMQNKLFLMAYAYSANEQNADRDIVVTAPTDGSCGVMASLMYYCKHNLGFDDDKLIDSLAVASIFGNLIKENATISGAMGGCQAEIGTACSMAAAAYAYLLNLSMDQIEYAAEIAMEHHLGLTCDPVHGLVIIPCIERNAVAVIRAIDAAVLSKYKFDISPNIVSFDTIINTMKDTGKMIPRELKETSLGGLATKVQ